MSMLINVQVKVYMRFILNYSIVSAYISCTYHQRSYVSVIVTSLMSF